MKAKTLEVEVNVDLSEFFFDVIQLKIKDCLGISLCTQRYDNNNIKHKKGVDPTPYLIDTPKLFKGCKFTIKKHMQNLTRVTFMNVRFNIPDEDIIHLCNLYGNPLNKHVYYENLAEHPMMLQAPPDMKK